jgi:hypothetical protein
MGSLKTYFIILLFLLFAICVHAEVTVDGVPDVTTSSGDVTAASAFGTDNVLVKSDGTGKAVQATGIAVTDANAVSGAASYATAQSSTSGDYWKGYEDSTNGTNYVQTHVENNQANTHLLSWPDSGEYGAAEVVGINYPFKECITIDPGAHYDVDTEVFITSIGDEAPNGIVIDEWSASCNVDPDVEIDADFRRATAFIGFGSAADIDEIDTSAGVSTEDTDANINGDAVVANGQELYLGFDADPEGTCVQFTFCYWWHPVGAAK